MEKKSIADVMKTSKEDKRTFTKAKKRKGGRPKVAKKQSTPITFRLNEEDDKVLTEIALLEGFKTASAFVKHLAMKKIAQNRLMKEKN